MKMTQVKGNTWVLEGWELIPLYKVNESQCILLDTGLAEERADVEQALLDAGLTPVGILGTHVHTDHSINHSCFRQKYRIPVALPVGEAGLCFNILDLKSYFFMLSTAAARAELSDMVCPTDVPVGPEDGPLTFCGAEFQIIHTPGHSPDHIAIVTPDDVCYVGDAMISGDELRAKLPFAFDHQTASVSRARLRGLGHAKYIVAHRGVYDEVDSIIDENEALIARREAEVLDCVEGVMSVDQIQTAVCARLGIRVETPQRAALMERNVRCYVEALLDDGRLTLVVQDAVRHCRRTDQI